MSVCYILTSPKGKQYVGVTESNIKRRWQQHVLAAKRGSSQLVHRMIRKYGAASVQVHTLVDSPIDAELLELVEQEAIKLFNTLAPHGYNRAEGGRLLGDVAKTLRFKKAVSEGSKNSWRGNEARKNIASANAKLHWSTADESRRKQLSDRVNTVWANPETRKQLSDRMKAAWVFRRARDMVAAATRVAIRNATQFSFLE